MTSISSALSPVLADTASPTGVDATMSRERMESVGVEFEGVFLSMMIKEMRNSLGEGGFFGEESSDTYGGMFDLFIGKHLAQSKPLGISEMLLQQYAKAQDNPTPDNASARPATSFTA